MNIDGFIELANRPPALRFLVIGGYAVAAHGHTRATFDVDFLALKEDRNAWTSKLTAAGLEKVSETNAFAQFSQKAGDGLDLMFVDAQTFEQMWGVAQAREFNCRVARMPSLDHLLALKLHALKQKSPHRTSKDAEDVELLVRRNRLDISLPQYEQLFLKYEPAKSTKHSCESSDTERAGDLELPVEPDFRPLPPLISIETMIQRSAELRKMFPDGIPTEEERLAAKVSEEFVL
jgi:hypothetical protein